MARADRWMLAGYAGVAGFVALEATARAPGEAASLHPAEGDRGTTRLLAAGYGLAAAMPLLLRRAPGGRLPASAHAAGLGLQAAGIGLRLWAMGTLHDSYSRTLRVTNAQVVVDRGPYRHVRHPGYLGSLLIWLGFGLASGTPAVTAAVMGLLVPAYTRRIAAEEELLKKELPGYEDYAASTTRLVPHLW